MSDILSFIAGHWVMVLLAVLALFWVIQLEQEGQGGRGMKAISPEDAVNLINKRTAVVIDVRSPDQFAQAHLIDAINIPLTQHFEKQLEEHPRVEKDTPLIMQCNLGQSSMRGVVRAMKAGFTEVYNLSGGIKAWKEADMPVITGAKGKKK